MGKNHKTQKITNGGQPGGCVNFLFSNEKIYLLNKQLFAIVLDYMLVTQINLTPLTR